MDTRALRDFALHAGIMSCVCLVIICAVLAFSASRQKPAAALSTCNRTAESIRCDWGSSVGWVVLAPGGCLDLTPPIAKLTCTSEAP